jgi:RNA polymerase-binding transcription factor DksA
VSGDTPDGALDAHDRAALRRELVAARDRTVDQLEALQRDYDEIVESSELTPPDDEHDPEGVTIAYQRAQLSALLDQGRDDLAALELALQRLTEGSASRCEGCGGPITIERLMALPSVRTCIACASSRRR